MSPFASSQHRIHALFRRRGQSAPMAAATAVLCAFSAPSRLLALMTADLRRHLLPITTAPAHA